MSQQAALDYQLPEISEADRATTAGGPRCGIVGETGEGFKVYVAQCMVRSSSAPIIYAPTGRRMVPPSSSNSRRASSSLRRL